MAGATKTVALQYLARAVALVLAAFVTALVTRRLGSDFVDWATIINAVALTGVILEPGLTPSMVRRLSQNPEGAPGVQAMTAVRLFLGLVALAVVVSVSIATRGPGIWLLALLLGGQVVARALVLNAVPWLQVDQRLHRAALLELGTAALGAGALAVGIQFDAPPPLLGVLAFTAPMAILALLMQHELARSPSACGHTFGPQLRVVLSVAREAAPLAGAIALAAVYTRSSIAFVNAYEGNAEASRFFFAFFFAEQCIVGAGILAGAVLPLMAHRARTADLRGDRVCQDLLLVTTAVGVVACGILLAGGPLFTQLLGGEALSGAEHYIWLLSPLAPIVFMSMTLAYLLISMGLGYQYLAFASLGVMANLVLNAVFTPEYGAYASARITWATELAAAAAPLMLLLLLTSLGRRTLATLTPLLGVPVAASEFVESGVLPGWVGAGIVIGVALVFSVRPLSRLRVATVTHE